MARKTLGFIPLIWQCPYCETQNPGPIKSCTSCGAPQPEDVAFKQVNQEEFDFIKDEALIRMAKAGPDIHCPYCGTRNPGTAERCSKCGGELSVGGKLREAGVKVESVSEVQEPSAETAPAPKKKLSRSSMVLVMLAVLACIAGFIVLMMLLFKTDEVTATVTDVGWERSIAVEALTTVTRSDWEDEIPFDADIGSCSMRYRYTSNEPVPNATEECSEPYVEDTGTGIGEVVQDCTYRVYDDFCEYTIIDWAIVDTATVSGDNLNPYWPTLNISEDQRLGQRSEQYTIVFSGGGETYTYTTSDSDLFERAEPGSRWILEINQLGGLQSIEPDY